MASYQCAIEPLTTDSALLTPSAEVTEAQLDTLRALGYTCEPAGWNGTRVTAILPASTDIAMARALLEDLQRNCGCGSLDIMIGREFVIYRTDGTSYLRGNDSGILYDGPDDYVGYYPE